VALGDVNGDGKQELLVGSGPGIQAQVLVYSLPSLQLLKRIDVIRRGYQGGVRVASGGVNGDHREDIVVGTMRGPGQVQAVDCASGQRLMKFEPFGKQGNLYVATGDLNLDGRADILVTNPNLIVRVFRSLDHQLVMTIPVPDLLYMGVLQLP